MKTKRNGKTKSVIPLERVKTYHLSNVKTPSGRKTLDTNDKVAKSLRGLTRPKLAKLASKKLGAVRVAKWKGLNDGMFRMVVGNALRGAHA